MMKKRTFAFLFSVLLCIGLVGTAFADSDINPGDFSINSGGNIGTGGSNNNNNNNTTYYPSVPSNPSYNVTAPASPENGKVSLDKTNAKKGDTVTITVTPDEGYQVDGVTVRDANGNAVDVTSLGGDKYSFTMPGSQVTVDVAFVEDIPVLVNPFTDVQPGAYYYDAVLWAVSKGITNGTSATTFSPNKTCTRAETVTFLWRAAGSPKPTGSNNPFVDVPSGAYYYDAILWAVENGITNGTSATTFSPNSTVTRGQVVTFQYRAAKAQAAAGNNPFVDVDSGAYYADAVQWAVNNGITNGTSASTFSPNNGCTRGQIVTFLYRADSN